MQKVRIAINGFGRIGRLFFRQAFDNEHFEFVAINDLSEIENLAYLLKHDSTYRSYPGEVSVEGDSSPGGDKGLLVVDGQRILVIKEKDPLKLPWKDLGIDIVVDATGIFNTFEKVQQHVTAGAKRAVITAPSKDDERADAKTILIGVNDEYLKTCIVTSNGSCTTNATTPVVAIMDETIGVEKAMLTTVHGYTATQSLVDGPTRGNDFRRGRAAAQNIIPATTGAAIAVTRVIPNLKDKFDGVAMRVPVLTGSLVDFTFLAKRKTSVEEVNAIFKKAIQDTRWNKVLNVTDEQLVSTDIIGESYGAIVDLNYTKVVDGDLVKVFSWYDNEWGYVSTLVQHVQKMAETL
ncbi:MAG: type I glyceraldehyde-3-phosphate dehydrogenase [Candidatus Harrisonbacteria bacterium CG10_big_fil_rev_8_21_14_0_10_42_17]|uniref:Type I glyceraldehyde-3-phosphate dehydrogenase n=1 Tax=Candidatus Harrisonbacteria bacterium CG10_big_fil_rev_8_21_14_0_10_42_17 TaxID=1974584 RepID=A0A2M6WIN2_9BACT|nr:MAG: type I glyceraldehyde-3-phosphate dehydrogenase [Candidatus Harrisonbacteria bacterium CG10_big_fil_rev_8_21_14_0_10_42_17]